MVDLGIVTGRARQRMLAMCMRMTPKVEGFWNKWPWPYMLDMLQETEARYLSRDGTGIKDFEIREDIMKMKQCCVLPRMSIQMVPEFTTDERRHAMHKFQHERRKR